MKYKFIFLIILVCALCYATPVLADTNIGGGGSSDFRECSTRYCYWLGLKYGSGQSIKIQGFRISIVDAQGNRIEGTKSVDYIQRSGHVDTFKEANFTMFTGTGNQSNGKYTKNEVLQGKAQGKKSNQPYTKDVILWPEMPTFIDVGANNMIVDYLDAKKASELGWGQLRGFLENCQYYPDNYTLEVMNTHSLLIEPLSYVKVTIKTPDLTAVQKIINYVGTATEVAQMMKMDGVPLWNGIFGTMYPQAIYVRDYQNPEGQGPWLTERAGLRSISDLIRSGVRDFSQYMLTNYGTAAGHYWVRDMLKSCEDTPDDLPKCCYLDQNKDKPICGGSGDDGGDEDDDDDDPDPIICKQPTVNCIDNCNVNTNGRPSGSIKDETDWQNCIFDKSNYYKGGNSYCSFYCREDISYYFPNGNTTVKAGSHFTVGDGWAEPRWTPIHFVGHSECQTKQINVSAFLDDWNSANKDVASKWDAYQIEKIKDRLNRDASKSRDKNCDTYCDYNDHGKSCCKKAEWEVTNPCYTGNPGGECIEKDLNNDGKIIGEAERCASRTPNTCEAKYEWVCKEDDEAVPHGYTMTPGIHIYTKVDGTTATINPSSWCSSSGSPSATYVSSTERAYQNAVNKRASIVNDIYDCNNWAREFDEFSPSIQLGYSEPRYGGVFTLDKSVRLIKETLYYNSDNSSPTVNQYSTSTKSQYECNNNERACTLTGTMTYPITYKLTQNTIREYNYYLPDNTYRYILKPSGESTSTRPASPSNYVDLGYGNLPVHYSRVAGNYDIYLNITTFGNGNKYNQYLQNRQCSNMYNCKYNVYNEILPTQEGINVIFRIISLTHPFPGEDGGGRTPGSNWDDESIKMYITKNRNLQNPERIYFDREPMYEINLNPAAIRRIRSYNRIQSAYNDGYADFVLQCQEGTGKKCKSNFVRGTEFRDIFVNTCGMDDNWNKCTIIDNGGR